MSRIRQIADETPPTGPVVEARRHCKTIIRQLISDGRSNFELAEFEINQMLAEFPTRFPSVPNPTKKAIKALYAQEVNNDRRQSQVAIPMAEDPMNRYAVVVVGANTRVYDRFRKTFMKIADFKSLFENMPSPVEDNDMSYGDWFMRNPNRPTYPNGMFMEVGGPPEHEGALNLWRGWGRKPVEGNWKRFRKHLKEIVCKSDAVAFGYLLNWMAWVLQNPNERAATVVVLRGIQGAGKGIIAEVMMHIFNKAHTFTASSPHQLVGNFTGWMRDCVFLFADEAFFAGDKGSRGRLKSLVTEGMISVEAKFVDAEMVENKMSMLMASNEEWVVPVETGDRRYFVIDMDNSKAQDERYFTPLWKELIEDGGVEAFFYDMLQRDLSNWNRRKVPMTSEKRRQALQTLTPVEKWWLHALQTGDIADRAEGFHSSIMKEEQGHSYRSGVKSWLGGDMTISTEILTKHFEDFTFGAGKDRENRKTSGVTIGRFLSKMGVGPSTVSPSGGYRVRNIERLEHARNRFADRTFYCLWETLQKDME